MFKKIKKFITNRNEYYPNIYILGYHLLKGIKKILIKIHLLEAQKLNRDMFDWPLYFLHYRGELKENNKKYLQSLGAGDYEFSGGKLVKKNISIKPLHCVHRFLYETILQLEPRSIFEIGCGTGANMHNLKTLLPQARVCGIDLSDRQLKGLVRTYPRLASSAKPSDATVPFSPLPFETCDVAFTQAVMMHIHTDNLHLVALENLFKMTKKYVVMHEKIKNHSFKADIQKLFDEGKIEWNKIFFYYRVNKETDSSVLIICSSTPLNYPALTDYNILLDKTLMGGKTK